MMRETELVMQTMEELNRRTCNGHIKIKMGTAEADEDRFRDIFDRFSRGTYFETMDLEIESVTNTVACECGYARPLNTDSYLPTRNCPRCGETLRIKGEDFTIVEPGPQDRQIE